MYRFGIPTAVALSLACASSPRATPAATAAPAPDARTAIRPSKVRITSSERFDAGAITPDD
jgi:hypothetical protein